MKRVTRIVTPAATTPVTLAEVKAHCRITSTDDDTILATYIAAAVALVEQILQRKLITQTWKMWLDYWPNHIVPMFGDLQSVTHIKYTDIDSVQMTLANTVYDVDTNTVPGRIILKDGEVWPSDILHAVNPIEVQFVTGYGAATTDIPGPIRSALLLTTAHLYENREPLLVSDSRTTTVTEIPWTAQTLLQPYRMWEWVL